jgi:hypothetical protein
MKHLVGTGVLIVMAFVLRFVLHTNLALDMHLHDIYRAVPLGIIAFPVRRTTLRPKAFRN